MKKIKLTQGKYTLVDDEDYEWLNDLTGWREANTHYAQLHKHSYNALMHRMVMFAGKGQEIDHKNGNRLDNRKCNLRFVTRSQNQMNRIKRPFARSEYKGLHFIKKYNKWNVHINYKGKAVHIGNFENPRHAAMAYDIWAKDIQGEYAKTNFPQV